MLTIYNPLMYKKKKCEYIFMKLYKIYNFLLIKLICIKKLNIFITLSNMSLLMLYTKLVK